MERMEGTRLKAARERMGLRVEDLAERLGVIPRTVRAWESGRDPIPYRVPDEVDALLAEWDALVEDLADRLERGEQVTAWGREDQHQAEHPGGGWTARAHRAAVMAALSRTETPATRVVWV